ncbi:IS1 family transposase [Candidatus Tisiphia endosymbiont of Beris chalybata]|uniref:IS1 family transposase n=1 Tax=Candidatus Tisiphia endosymbiont of Beris chalybata TaxID=3066262 RepID=UPI003977B1C8
MDIEVTKDRSFASYLPLAFRLEHYNIKYLCTDDYDVYSKYKISKKHIIDKAETCLVEAKNSSYRDNLARLDRKTKKYSKCSIMLALSLYILLFLKTFGYLINCL